MSEQNICTISIAVGAQAGTVNRPLFRVPKSTSGFGGISITGAYLCCGGAATSVMQLNNMGTSLGTTIVANVGTLNGTMVANVQQAISITTAYQASGTWLALSTGAGGALDTVSNVTIEYVWGK